MWTDYYDRNTDVFSFRLIGVRQGHALLCILYSTCESFTLDCHLLALDHTQSHAQTTHINTLHSLYYLVYGWSERRTTPWVGCMISHRSLAPSSWTYRNWQSQIDNLCRNATHTLTCLLVFFTSTDRGHFSTNYRSLRLHHTFPTLAALAFIITSTGRDPLMEKPHMIARASIPWLLLIVFVCQNVESEWKPRCATLILCIGLLHSTERMRL